MRSLSLACGCVLVVLSLTACGGVKEQPVADNLLPELKEGDPSVLIVLFSRGGVQGMDHQRRLISMMRNRTNRVVRTKEVDIDIKSHLGRAYGVTEVPWVILFDKDGKKVFNKRGAATESELISELNKLGVEVAPMPEPTEEEPLEQPMEPEEQSGSSCPT